MLSSDHRHKTWRSARFACMCRSERIKILNTHLNQIETLFEFIMSRVNGECIQ